jgi:hypothetical protein
MIRSAETRRDSTFQGLQLHRSHLNLVVPPSDDDDIKPYGYVGRLDT